MRTARAPISEPISKLAAELPELSFRIASIPQRSSWGGERNSPSAFRKSCGSP